MNISKIPEWLRGHSPESIKFYLDVLSIHNRPENGEIETPPTIDKIRISKLEGRLSTLESKQEKTDSALRRGLNQLLKMLN